MNDECCGKCRFWLPVTDDDGYCRRYPPTVTTVVTLADGIHNDQSIPEMKHDSWCGEFKPKEWDND